MPHKSARVKGERWTGTQRLRSYVNGRLKAAVPWGGRHALHTNYGGLTRRIARTKHIHRWDRCKDDGIVAKGRGQRGRQQQESEDENHREVALWSGKRPLGRAFVCMHVYMMMVYMVLSPKAILPCTERNADFGGRKQKKARENAESLVQDVGNFLAWCRQTKGRCGPSNSCSSRSHSTPPCHASNSPTR